jgi:hypothetical protein
MQTARFEWGTVHRGEPQSEKHDRATRQQGSDYLRTTHMIASATDPQAIPNKNCLQRSAAASRLSESASNEFTAIQEAISPRKYST